MTKHDLTETARTAKYTQFQCCACRRGFRVLAGRESPIPEDCGEVPSPVAPSDAVPTPQGTFNEPTDARQPPIQVATREEQQRRLLICGRCVDLNTCLPTICAKRKAVETGQCPQGKWDAPDYSRPVEDAVETTAFVVRYKGFRQNSKDWRVSTLPARSTGPRTKLYAMISTWHEADIVEAAVANCFAEGCDRVYVLDNDSPDGTAHLAVKAGAILARTYTTAAYQDVYRVRLMNEAMQAVTEAEKLPELWWMSLDCDEFPRGPNGTNVRQFLQRIPEDCNTVGADAFDHYPTEPIANVPGKHPADYQPCGWLRKWIRGAFCSQGHWKHSVVRYRHGVFDAIQMRGLHDAWTLPSRGPTIEPKESILLHHFMYRNEAETRARLERLCGGGDDRRSKPDDTALGNEGAYMRYKMLDAVYAGDWKNVRMPHMQAYADLQAGGCPLVHWSEVFEPWQYEPRRWY